MKKIAIKLKALLTANNKQLLLLFCALVFTGIIYAQSPNSKITLSFSNAKLIDVFSSIEKQSGLFFLYNEQSINVNQYVTVDVKNATLNEALTKVFETKNINYTISKKQIILSSTEIPKNTIEQLKSTAKKQISGTVIDGTNKETLIGVNVKVVGASLGTITDINGSFKLEVPEDAILAFSYIGYGDTKINIKDKSILNVVLQPESKLIDEVVVIGYGVQRKRDLTGAISSVDMSQLRKSTTVNAVNSLQGRVAGVSVEQTGGAPGESFQVKIRGTGTLNGNNPLYVIDDMLADNTNGLNSSDIESVQVLKDASAAAIYGSRAANGVVIITTKKGKINQPLKIDFNSYYGVTSIINSIDLCNAQEYAMLNNFANDNAGKPRNPRSDTDFNPLVDTNWQNEVYGGTRPTSDINFSISGGSQDIAYSISAGKFNQEGIKINTDYNRNTFRINSSIKKGIFKLGENFNFSFSDKNNGYSSSRPVEVEVLRQVPTLAIYNVNNLGGYGGADKLNYGYDGGNPVGILNMITNKYDEQRILGNFYMDVNLHKGLIFRSSYGIETSYNHSYLFKPAYIISTVETNDINSLTESRGQSYKWIFDNTLNYNRLLGKNSIGLMIGTSAQSYWLRGLSASVQNLPGTLQTIESAKSNMTGVGGDLLENSMLSYFGRLSYSYDEKYMLTANVRRDGSSKFKSGNQWGTFPSVSVAWRVSKEGFMTNINKYVNDLKIRLSAGKLGNQTINEYGYSSLISAYSDYPFGVDPGVGASLSSSNIGMTVTDFSNPSIRWESTTTKGIGLDAEFFKSKLMVNFDVWERLTEDMLTRVPIPLSVGSLTNPYMNVGSIKNSGVELTLTYRDKVGEFKYEISGNVSTIKNNVVKLTGDASEAGYKSATIESGIYSTTWTKVGYPIGGFWLYESLGTYKTDEQLLANKPSNRTVKLGDLEYRDQLTVDSNGDGIPDKGDGRIDVNDLVYQGSAFPTFEGGLNFSASYHDIDISLFLHGKVGNKVYNANNWYIESANESFNYSKRMLNYWDPILRPNSDIPVPTTGDPAGNAKLPSDRWLEDGSFLRLKNIQIGYSLPEKILKNIYIQKARLYVSAQNVFTISNYSGYDPEVGGDGLMSRGFDSASYPLYKTFLVGIQLSL